MVKDAMYRNEAPTIIGARYTTLHGLEFILAMVDHDDKKRKVCLVSLKDGNRWRNPVDIDAPREEIFGTSHLFTLVSVPKAYEAKKIGVGTVLKNTDSLELYAIVQVEDTMVGLLKMNTEYLRIIEMIEVKDIHFLARYEVKKLLKDLPDMEIVSNFDISNYVMGEE